MKTREWVTITLAFGLFATLIAVSHLCASERKKLVYKCSSHEEIPSKSQGDENFCGGKISILIRFASLLASCRDQVDSYRI